MEVLCDLCPAQDETFVLLPVNLISSILDMKSSRKVRAGTEAGASGHYIIISVD